MEREKERESERQRQRRVREGEVRWTDRKRNERDRGVS